MITKKIRIYLKDGKSKEFKDESQISRFLRKEYYRRTHHVYQYVINRDLIIEKNVWDKNYPGYLGPARAQNEMQRIPMDQIERVEVTHYDWGRECGREVYTEGTFGLKKSSGNLERLI